MKKLGRLKKKHDPRNLQFAKYLNGATPTPPIANIWENAPPMGMLLNDTLGDCTIAAILHAQRIWSKQNSIDYVPTNTEALNGYEAVGGYIPGNPSTDNGCFCLDVLNHAQKTGIGGRKIGPFVEVDVQSITEVKLASYWFGGLYIGIDMPISCQNQPWGWSVPKGGPTGDGQPGSWGGHCVDVIGYNSHGPQFITWGKRLPMTWAFWKTYVTECYAILSNDFVVNPDRAPNGFDIKTLISDLNIIKK